MDDAEATRLEQLEVDISAVASALETVDRIVAETTDGESAAAEIAAVVSPQRFPVESDEAPSEPHVQPEGDHASPSGGPEADRSDPA